MKNALNALPIFERDGRFILQKTFEGVGQKTVSLGKDKVIAEKRAKRFLACAEINGFQTALDELKGKPTIKKGDDLDFEQIKTLYLEYMEQSENPIREISIKQVLAALKRIMNGKTLSKVDMEEVKSRLLKDPKNKANRTSFDSMCRNAKGAFKENAMKYYEKKKKTVFNPLKDFEFKSPSIEAYTPFSKEILEKMLTRMVNLPPQEQLIISLCLNLALRRSEATALRNSWWSVQESKVFLSIQPEEGFIPKSGEKRIIPVELELYQEFVNLRKKCIENDPSLKDNEFFIPVEARQGTPTTRLHRRFASVNEFLKGLGIKDQKPCHGLRKYGGSVICAKCGLPEASRILGHSDIKVTMKHYIGILENTPIAGIKVTKEKDPLQADADRLGISLDALRLKLSQMS